MPLRIACLLILVASVAFPADAQTVRFDTNVGTFDIELNPTGNPNLQGHVDNMLQYVENGLYDLTVIHRAAENDNDDPLDDFVLQLGGFGLNSFQPPERLNDLPAIERFEAIVVDADGDGAVDFDVSNLLNTRGSVSLALSGEPNSGTSGFFVNLSDNANLDSDSLRFVPFAEVRDFSTINLIMGFEQLDLPDGGEAGDDFPLLPDERVVFIERAFVLPEGVMGPVAPALAFPGGESDVFSPPTPQAQTIVPEPPALVIAVGAFMLIAALTRGKIR